MKIKGKNGKKVVAPASEYIRLLKLGGGVWKDRERSGPYAQRTKTMGNRFHMSTAV